MNKQLRTNLKAKRIALILSGGGAKGAYQVGMFRALEEAGLDKEKISLAGTSIGALNALMYAVRNTDAMREMICSFGNLKEDAEQYAASLFPDELLMKNRIPVTVCAYCIEKERPEYFYLPDLEPQEQRKMVLASASLPDLLPPIRFRGYSYLDGGKIPPQCSENAAEADKIPVRALKDEEYDLLIISYLKPEDAAVPPGIRKPVLELRPSEPLEDEAGTGTRDYSPERLLKSEKMGYEETIRALSCIPGCWDKNDYRQL